MCGFGHATILIPSFHGLHKEYLGPQPPFCVLNMKKKKGSSQIMSLTAYARETNKVKKNTSINVTCPML